MNYSRCILVGCLASGIACAGLYAQSTPPSTSAPSASPAPVAPVTPPSADVLAQYFGTWPDGTSPKDIGKKVADNFAGRQFRFQTAQYANNATSPVIYPEVVCWYGAFTFAEATKDDALKNKLIAKFGVLSTPEGAAHISAAAAVDYHVFGAVPLVIYMLTKQQGYLTLGQSFADRQWATPRDDGLSGDTRFWVDDLYMLPLVEMQAYRATQDKKYLDRVALTFSIYLDRLQQPSGLFYHGEGVPYYWSRGDGWVAAGLTELLRDLPADHPLYPKIFAGYQKMMAGLLKYQADDGLWKQLIDHPEAYSESSGSAMFTFAFVSGVKNGWLDANTYGPAARKAWLGLVKLIDENGNIANVCVGTNKYSAATNGPDPIAYYLTRPVDKGPQMLTSDVLHGNAPVLWTATALLR
jgi:unsaturated rhamnogalacturonyl hydrolase